MRQCERFNQEFFFQIFEGDIPDHAEILSLIVSCAKAFCPIGKIRENSSVTPLRNLIDRQINKEALREKK